MTREEIRVDNQNFDNFPTGMRVLAVDDNAVCLKLLETMLIKCQYHVTVTSHARTALNMLRENKDKFDLVISDVHMPDMDGFKLLELVGLEMDLPVIMLSANSDAKLVMKGVSHGACDYLVKPVRYQELKNIWQHVIRRKKSGSRKQNNQTVDQGKAHQTSGEANESLTTGDEDNQNEKKNRKRKDEVEDESEDNDNGNDSDDPASQKKPRVVWSLDLHRKFVAAVHQLGFDKAVPKKILDLMNVEGLSRENVASHLQKYRISLRKLPQPANMASALGARDPAFMHLGSLDRGLGKYQTGSSSTYISGGGVMFGRLNSPANVNLHNITQPSHTLPNTALSRMHQIPSLLQGTPSSTDAATINDKRYFNSANSFIMNGSSNFLNGTQNNSLMLHGNNLGFGNQAASFDQALDFDTIELPSLQQYSLLSTEPFKNTARENNLTNGHHLVNNSIGNMACVSLEDVKENMQFFYQEEPNERWGEHVQKYGHASSNSNNTINMFGSLKDRSTNIPAYNGILSTLNQKIGNFKENLERNSIENFNQKMDMILNGRSTGGGSTPLQQQNDNGNSVIDSIGGSKENSLVEETTLQGVYASQSYNLLDDLANDDLTPVEYIDDFLFGQDV